MWMLHVCICMHILIWINYCVDAMHAAESLMARVCVWMGPSKLTHSCLEPPTHSAALQMVRWP